MVVTEQGPQEALQLVVVEEEVDILLLEIVMEVVVMVVLES